MRSHFRVWLFVTPWTSAHQALLTSTILWSLLKFMATESVMLSNYLILCYPLLLLPSVFPSIRVFSKESALCIKGPSIVASASVLPVNIQSWFPLNWLILSPCSPRDSQESSPAAQFNSISSLALSFLYGPMLTSINDYWENHSFDCMDFYQQNDVPAF